MNGRLPRKWKTDPEDQMTDFPGSAGLRSALLSHCDDRSTTPNHRQLIADQTTATKSQIQKLFWSAWATNTRRHPIDFTQEHSDEIWWRQTRIKLREDCPLFRSGTTAMQPAQFSRVTEIESETSHYFKRSQPPPHMEIIGGGGWGGKKSEEGTEPEGRWAEQLPVLSVRSLKVQLLKQLKATSLE